MYIYWSTAIKKKQCQDLQVYDQASALTLCCTPQLVMVNNDCFQKLQSSILD